jgi:hypothetical protein
MNKNQQIVYLFFALVIVGVILYFVMTKGKSIAGGGTVKLPGTTPSKPKSKTTTKQTVPGPGDSPNMGVLLDTSGNIEVGDTIVCHSPFAANVVQKDLLFGYIQSLDDNGSPIPPVSFNMWEVIGTVADIQYGKDGGQDYALVQTEVTLGSTNVFFNPTGAAVQYYQCPFDKVEVQ